MTAAVASAAILCYFFAGRSEAGDFCPLQPIQHELFTQSSLTYLFTFTLHTLY